LPQPAGFGVDVPVGEIGWTIVGAVAAATAAHGVGKFIRDRVVSPESEDTNAASKTGSDMEEK
jgi:hydrogenase small subunit